MTVLVSDPDFVLHVGDVREELEAMPDGSVDCVVTSPPYWGLRDYGTGVWDGGNPDCDHTTPSRVDAVAAVATSTLVGSKDTQGHLQEPSYRDRCGKCGARRQDQQLGLEPTPDAYITSMVAVFREVHRVLADHGTCWVNIGDSYAGSSMDGGHHEARPGARFSSTLGLGDLKPKDLVGIPWKLAFALQQPYYTGRIKDERDRIWLAAMVDAEGCIHIHRRKAGSDSGAKFTKKDGTTVSYARTQDTYGVMVSIDNTSKAIIDRCEEIVGQGSRYVHEKATGQQQRKQTLYRLTLTGQQSRELLRELYPHLVAKQHEARIAYHAPSSGDDAAACHEAIKALHNGRETTIDKPLPPTLFEPGWYLRSDICWSKSNPMPESVTDRPTKSHEYVFLLSKRPRYWFDQDAVREPHATPLHAPGNKFDPSKVAGPMDRGGKSQWERDMSETWGSPAGRNVRSVWEIPTQPYAEAHFATYPEELVRRCLLAGCPERVCVSCGRPSERIVETNNPSKWAADPDEPETDSGQPLGWANTHSKTSNAQSSKSLHRNPGGVYSSAVTLGWSDCDCKFGAGRGSDTEGEGARNTLPTSKWRPGVVLDPFLGSGTTALVARKHGRRCVGIELNPEYAELAVRRNAQQTIWTTA